MKVFDTISLPFCIITVAAAPDKVETLHDLPDFLVPIKWKQSIVTNSESMDMVNPAIDAKIAIHFSNVKAPDLKSNRKQTTKDMFLVPNVMAMVERAIMFSLDQMHVRRKVREHIGEGEVGKVRSYTVADLNDAMRNVIADGLAFHSYEQVSHGIFLRRNKEGTQDVSVLLQLGGGVSLRIKPQTMPAPLSSNQRLRGTVGVGDDIYNFHIWRPFAPMIFKEFVTEQILQTAFRSTLEEFDSAPCGEALVIADDLDFVADGTFLPGTPGKEDDAE